MNYLFFGIAFISFWFLRGIYYFTKVRKMNQLKDEYYKYLNHGRFDFLQNKQQIIELFKLAGVKNFGATYVQPVSYGQGIIHNLNGFNNINVMREDIIGNVRMAFEESIGVFKNRMRQSFNPIYWIELVIRLPEKLFSFVSITPPTSIMKIIQLLYWIVGFLIALDKFHLIKISDFFN